MTYNLCPKYCHFETYLFFFFATGNFDETKARVVEIKDVTFLGLKSVVQCIYTTKIDVNADNISDILPAAHLLQMADIVEECKQWMSGQVTKENCFDFLRLAERYNIETVEVSITDFILQNFVEVSQMEGFLEVSKQALCRYLSSDVLKTDLNEYSVYKAARNWILKNNVSDAITISEIMRNVRFALIPPMMLSEQVFIDDLADNKPFRTMVAGAMKYHADVYRQPFYRGISNKPRGRVGVLVIPTGERLGDGYITDRNGHIDFIPIPIWQTGKQSTSLNMPIVHDSMKAVTINNFLFLFACTSDGFQNFTMRYDATIDSWIKLEPVPRAAIVGSSAMLLRENNQVVLTGGMEVNADSVFEFDSDKVIADTYIYDVEKNTWSRGNDLPQGLTNSAAAIVGDFGYVTGGFSSSNETTDTTYAYDIKAKLWLTKARMNQSRCDHLLNVINDKLHAVGGHVVHGQAPTCHEIYDTLSNQWTQLLRSGTYQLVGGSSLVHGSKIVIFGGKDRAKQIHVYDIDKKIISRMGAKLPSPSASNVCAPFIMPKLL